MHKQQKLRKTKNSGIWGSRVACQGDTTLLMAWLKVTVQGHVKSCALKSNTRRKTKVTSHKWKHQFLSLKSLRLGSPATETAATVTKTCLSKDNAVRIKTTGWCSPSGHRENTSNQGSPLYPASTGYVYIPTSPIQESTSISRAMHLAASQQRLSISAGPGPRRAESRCEF